MPPRLILGSAFTADIGWTKSKFRLVLEGKKRTIKTPSIQSVRVLTSGYTKIRVQAQKDLVIPTTGQEAVKLVAALNAILSEHQSVEVRRRQAARRARVERSNASGTGGLFGENQLGWSGGP